MGWNTVTPAPGSALFTGIDPGARFYFVHSYALRAPAARELAAAEQGALAATQFHPEKSGDAGAALLANWLGTLS